MVMHVTLVLAAKRHTKEGSSGLICESDFPNKVLFVKVPEKGQKFQLFNITRTSHYHIARSDTFSIII